MFSSRSSWVSIYLWKRLQLLGWLIPKCHAYSWPVIHNCDYGLYVYWHKHSDASSLINIGYWFICFRDPRTELQQLTAISTDVIPDSYLIVNRDTCITDEEDVLLWLGIRYVWHRCTLGLVVATNVLRVGSHCHLYVYVLIYSFWGEGKQHFQAWNFESPRPNFFNFFFHVWNT